MEFIVKVFLNLLFQIMVMYVSAKKSVNLIGPPSGYDLILYFGKFLLLILIAFVPMPIQIKFLGPLVRTKRIQGQIIIISLKRRDIKDSAYGFV